MSYQPEWDIDLSYGAEGEKTVAGLLGLGGQCVEVKHKRRLDMGFYVETWQSPGASGDYKPSGINVTRADVWAYVIGDTGVVVLVPTVVLRAAARGCREVEETDGDNPTKGRLVSFMEILRGGVRG